MRIDKYLWTVRIFKTRNQAAEACKKGQVLINDFGLKPSRMMNINDVFDVRMNPITKKFRIIGFPNNRVAAKLVVDFLEDITPQSELDKLELIKNAPNPMRDRGTGRPTKKDRREFDKWVI